MEQIMPSLKWVRKENGMVAGVCKGVASALDVETWLIRLIFLILLCAGGFGLLVYLMMWVSFPRANNYDAISQKVILGVCLELHRRGDIELGLGRLIALSLLIVSFGAAVIGYFILYIILKK